MRTKLSIVAGLCLALSGLASCSSTKKPATLAGLPGRAPLVAMRSFSETQPYTALALLGGHVYAGTPNGVIRFTKGTREYVRLTRERGLSGNRISALATTPSSGLWVATEGGISHLSKGVWSNHALSKSTRPPVVAMVADKQGVWAGAASGLGRLVGGKWRAFLPGVNVRHLVGDLSGGGVWVATAGEGLYHFEKGKFVPHSTPRGQLLRAVRSMAHSSSGALFAVGNLRANNGKLEDERLAYYDGRHWATFELSPPARLLWVAQVRGRMLLATKGRMFVLRRADLTLGGPKELPTGPLRLAGKRSPVAPSRYPVPYFYTEPLSVFLPSKSTVVVGQGNQVLIGTRTTGAVVFDGKAATWYRTSDLVGAADKLKVACESGSACYLAGGNGLAYRFDGARFARVAIDADAKARVLGFALGRDRKVVALYTLGDKLMLSRHAGSVFQRFAELAIKAPNNPPMVRFARYGNDGRLWIGLAYRDKEKTVRPWGVVVVGQDGKALAHRSTLLPSEDRAKGSLALPDDIRGILFGKSGVWLATGHGVCHVDGTRVTLYTENEGMESEITYGIAQRDNGEILAATYGGLGRYNGKAWFYDIGGLRGTVTRAVAATKNVIYVGTDSGLVTLRGNSRVNVRAADGLASDRVRDVRMLYGKLWVLTSAGLSLLDTPVHKK